MLWKRVVFRREDTFGRFNGRSKRSGAGSLGPPPSPAPVRERRRYFQVSVEGEGEGGARFRMLNRTRAFNSTPLESRQFGELEIPAEDFHPRKYAAGGRERGEKKKVRGGCVCVCARAPGSALVSRRQSCPANSPTARADRNPTARGFVYSVCT